MRKTKGYDICKGMLIVLDESSVLQNPLLVIETKSTKLNQHGEFSYNTITAFYNGRIINRNLKMFERITVIGECL